MKTKPIVEDPASALSKTSMVYVGLDVHKDSISVALAMDRGGEAQYVKTITNDLHAVEKLVAELRKRGGTLRFVYLGTASSPPLLWLHGPGSAK